ncbi:MAG: cupin domain-containing protein [Alphaproteobacteria bacterium]
MKKTILATLATVAVFAASSAFAQTQKQSDHATVVSAEQIEAVATKFKGGDHEVQVVDVGPYNVGVAVLSRGALKAGGALNGINHTKITEAYYVVSGEGTFITANDAGVTNVKPLAADNELVTTVVGPGNTATITKVLDSVHVKTGDVVVIPPGIYHGFSEIPDHIQYVTIRPDTGKVLPGGYVNPEVKK